jgi:ADP-ribosyl-[dinitrogen reductase] hydrolase
MTPREIAHRHGTHREISGGGWLHLAPGQVTDDTTMSLALGDALLRGAREGRPFDTRLMADAFVAWLQARPVDCGNTCRRGIQRYLSDASLEGPMSEGDGGNGALMRNLPVALATLGDDARLAQASIAQAHLTHHQLQSDAATLAFGRMVHVLVQTDDADSGSAACSAIADALVASQPAFRWQPYPGRASAYVVDTVQTVLAGFFGHADFETALVWTVNQGHDADTTGALLGMLAGARCGAQALPRRWLDRLDRATRIAITDQTAALLALTGA